MKLNPKDWLSVVRKFTCENSLDLFLESKRDTLTPREFMRLLSAVEHRRVEISTGMLFDKLPPGSFR